MAEPIITYDEISDTLYISFAPGETATGIELNEHLLLRINRRDRRAVGLTVLNYSLLAQPTELGPRSVPLTGLAALAPDLLELVIELLRTPPVEPLLALQAYTPSLTEVIPIATLQPLVPSGAP